PFGNVTAVANGDFLEVSLGDLSEECSHALGEDDVGLHLGVLFGRDGGNVDRVLNHTVLEIFLNLLCDLDADGFLRFVGGSADVRGEDYVIERKQRGVLWGLFSEDIDGRGGNVALLEALREISFVDEFSSGAVHQAHAFLHLGDGDGIDHTCGLGRQAYV